MASPTLATPTPSPPVGTTRETLPPAGPCRDQPPLPPTTRLMGEELQVPSTLDQLEGLSLGMAGNYPGSSGGGGLENSYNGPDDDAGPQISANLDCPPPLVLPCSWEWQSRTGYVLRGFARCACVCMCAYVCVLFVCE